jgi:beta-glucosidase
VKELKGFQKIYLKAGESKTVTFDLTADDLRFYTDQLQYIYEPGDFKVFVGGSSADVKEAAFSLVK